MTDETVAIIGDAPDVADVIDEVTDDEPETSVDVDVAPVVNVDVIAPVADTAEPVEDTEPADDALTTLAVLVGGLVTRVEVLSERIDNMTVVAEDLAADVDDALEEDETVNDDAETDDDDPERIAPQSSKPHPIFRSWRDWRRN